MTLVNADTGEVVGRSLVECEQVIERGLHTFIEVGQALMEIRDGRLYKATHGDFDSYCRERWGWNRSRAGHLIRASEAVAQLGTDVPVPVNEAQVRPLTPLPTPEARREAWAEANRKAASEERPVTARDVEEAVKEMSALKDALDEAKSIADELAHLTPSDFDPVADAETSRQRGEFLRLVRDLSSIDRDAFLRRQRPFLRADHLVRATEARDWLVALCDAWEATP